ncbi:MAG: PEP-CTERM sorting domain-containing protein [Caldilineaceae bacterium]|nr:PEP-CTERM sorting domain-containing protein [Caldilineaceae bacterium]
MTWKSTRFAKLVLGPCLAILLGMAILKPAARGAVVLDFFEVTPQASGVLLTWSTLAEFNLEGFNINVKEATAPPTEYQIIGTEAAQGGVDRGYFYTFDVGNLAAGIAYCFRIQEIVTDGTAPEAFDRCGYGIDVTPTPTLPPAPISPLPLTPIFESPLSTPTSNPLPLSTPLPPEPVAVPEPFSIVLFGAGVAAASLFVRRKRRP